MLRFPAAARIVLIAIFLTLGVSAILFGFYVDRGQNITGRIFIITGILALLLSSILIFFSRSETTE